MGLAGGLVDRTCSMSASEHLTISGERLELGRIAELLKLGREQTVRYWRENSTKRAFGSRPQFRKW